MRSAISLIASRWSGTFFFSQQGGIGGALPEKEECPRSALEFWVKKGVSSNSLSIRAAGDVAEGGDQDACAAVEVVDGGSSRPRRGRGRASQGTTCRTRCCWEAASRTMPPLAIGRRSRPPAWRRRVHGRGALHELALGIEGQRLVVPVSVDGQRGFGTRVERGDPLLEIGLDLRLRPRRRPTPEDDHQPQLRRPLRFHAGDVDEIAAPDGIALRQSEPRAVEILPGQARKREQVVLHPTGKAALRSPAPSATRAHCGPLRGLTPPCADFPSHDREVAVVTHGLDELEPRPSGSGRSRKRVFSESQDGRPRIHFSAKCPRDRARSSPRVRHQSVSIRNGRVVVRLARRESCRDTAPSTPSHRRPRGRRNRARASSRAACSPTGIPSRRCCRSPRRFRRADELVWVRARPRTLERLHGQ